MISSFGGLMIGLGQMQPPGLHIKEIWNPLSLSPPDLAQQSMGSLGTSVEPSSYSSPSAVGKSL